MSASISDFCLEMVSISLSSKLVTRLQSFSGAGKAAKLTKQLLARKEGDPALEAEACAQVLEARIARAERWSRNE